MRKKRRPTEHHCLEPKDKKTCLVIAAPAAEDSPSRREHPAVPGLYLAYFARRTHAISKACGTRRTLRPSTRRCPPASTPGGIIDGQLISSRTHNTPGYELTFEVVEGEFRGAGFGIRYCAPGGSSACKRDLAKLGISDLHQLAAPLPPGMRRLLDVVIRRDDADVERNRVRRFEVVGVDKTEPDPYAPAWDAVDWDDADYDNEESNVSEDEPIDISQHLVLDEDDDNDQLLMHA